jgi:hypothetical protein
VTQRPDNSKSREELDDGGRLPRPSQPWHLSKAPKTRRRSETVQRLRPTVAAAMDLLDQNLVGTSSPQADLKPAMIAFTPLFCMGKKKEEKKPMKTFANCNVAKPASKLCTVVFALKCCSRRCSGAKVFQASNTLTIHFMT